MQWRVITAVDATDDINKQLEMDLIIALEKEELRLYYQPKVDMVSGQIVGVEALIRWEHPEKGMISPVDFIPVAEETGLILPIGEWVLRTACRQNRMWQEAGLRPFIMAVNLSALQLYQPDLVQVVQEILVETKLAPEYLELEITESMMMDVQHVLPIVQQLKQIGVRLSLDDFGTGYSSLHYLKDFPIDEIKIDQSFVRACTPDTKDATIVKAIIAMAHQLNLDVVAEGVETKEQLFFLQQHLCNKAQGYLYSKPVLPEELVQNFANIEKTAKQEEIPQEASRKKWLEVALENARQELQETVRQQQGMILKFTERNGKFIHTLCDGELLYKIGLTPQKLLGKELYEVLPYQEAERKSTYYRKAWQGQEDISYEGQLNGVSYFASLRPILRAGQVVEVIASCVDITERIESEERFQKIAEYSLTGVAIYRDGRMLYANPAALKILREEEKSIDSFSLADFPKLAEQALSEAEMGKELPITEMNLTLRDGKVIDIEMATVSINYDGSPAVLALFSDETKRKEAERIFEKSTKELKDVNFALNESSIVAITNRTGIIQFVNDKFCEISKYTRAELMGQDHKILNSGYHPKAFFKGMWKAIGQGKTWRGEIRNKAKDGSFYWVHTTVVPFLNDKGIPYQYVSIRTDVTERKQVEEALRRSEEKLTYMAYHDTLTDLPNRRLFLKELEKSLEEAKRYERKMAVIFIDMDEFKQINDSFGHDVGDEILKCFARIVQECLHENTIFARQGGDEFTILIPEIQEEQDAVHIANRIINSLQDAKRMHQMLCKMTASLGIAFYPKDGKTGGELMKYADRALYRAKAEGRNSYRLYS
ncbi:EAL domain-containing protein [Sporosarcina sp. FSL K6-1522]|uniref:EAL domain-containing protein n=1 Tax=Sporosarcina sp. FSL K6-1522 TaxID=2921554 RepID=UPI00315A1798